MAERLRDMFSLEQLEKEVTCGICQDHYTDPKILPCLHYYCKQCVLRLVLRTPTGEPFHCPECRCEVTLPEEGVEGLKSAFFIGRLESIWKGLQHVQVKVEDVCCETFSSANSSSFCVQCAKYICSTCDKAHQGHQIVPHQNIIKERKLEATADTVPIEKCKLHNEELKLYCFHCDTLICRDCTIVDHKEHKFQFSAVAAPETKRKLMTDLEPLKLVGDKLTQAVEEVKTTKEKVQAQGLGVALTINISFDEIVQIVEQRRKELLQETERRVQEKVDNLIVQEKTLSLANAEVQSVLDYTERCVEHGTDNEVMSMQGKIRSQINVVCEQNNLLHNTKPVEVPDVGVEVRCSEKVHQICQSEAKVTQLPVDLAQYTVVGEGTRKAVINQTAEFTVIATTLTTGKHTKHQGMKIDSSIKSLFNNHVIKCDVYEMAERGCYRISYTPSYRGRHELTVSVDKHQIPDSPLSVYVDTLPSQLGEPVEIVYGVDCISDIAVNSSGITVIAKQDGDPIEFYKGQKKLSNVSRDYLKLDSYTVIGIDIDSKDFIYFTLHNLNMLVKLDREGNLVLKARSKQNTGNLGLAVVGDEVGVCPRHHNGTIMIYDHRLKFKRKIVGNDMGEFRDISSDSEGKFFVTDWTMNYIRVFSPCGSALQSFDFHQGVSSLKMRGICVSGQFVYVCAEYRDILNSGVLVFTTDGDYVSIIGSGAIDRGQLLYPHGMHINQDGYIFATDTSRFLVI